MGVFVWCEMSPMRDLSFSFSAATCRAEVVDAAR